MHHRTDLMPGVGTAGGGAVEPLGLRKKKAGIRRGGRRRRRERDEATEGRERVRCGLMGWIEVEGLPLNPKPRTWNVYTLK